MTHRLWRPTFVLVEVALLLAIPVLAIKGFDAVLDTTEGQAVDPELDPADPGYEAFLEPTAVQAVVGLADDGTLSWVAVLALGGPGGAGGSVVLVPAATLAPADEAEAFPAEPLRVRYAREGLAATRQGVADVLGVGVDEVVDLSPPRLAELLGPVAPLTVANPDAIGDFASGELVLAADEAVALLLASDPEESDLTRLTRHEAVWQAWLAAIAASSDPDVVPGERSTGIGRFVRGLAAGAATFAVPPGAEQVSEEFAGVVYVTDPAEAIDAMEDLVPFPAAARPGDRLRVRVLDGTGADGLQLALARDVVRAGGQVVVVGNADNFAATESRAVYFDGALAERAEAMGAELGLPVEQIEGLNPDDRVDVTVVAGSDLLATYGLTRRSSTNGDSAG